MMIMSNSKPNGDEKRKDGFNNAKKNLWILHKYGKRCGKSHRLCRYCEPPDSIVQEDVLASRNHNPNHNHNRNNNHNHNGSQQQEFELIFDDNVIIKLLSLEYRYRHKYRPAHITQLQTEYERDEKAKAKVKGKGKAKEKTKTKIKPNIKPQSGINKTKNKYNTNNTTKVIKENKNTNKNKNKNKNKDTTANEDENGNANEIEIKYPRAGLHETIKRKIIKSIKIYDAAIDSKQTPYVAHGICVTQHILGVCCRWCLKRWYKIDYDVILSDDMIEKITNFVYYFIVNFILNGSESMKNFMNEIPKKTVNDAFFKVSNYYFYKIDGKYHVAENNENNTNNENTNKDINTKENKNKSKNKQKTNDFASNFSANNTSDVKNSGNLNCDFNSNANEKSNSNSKATLSNNNQRQVCVYCNMVFTDSKAYSLHVKQEESKFDNNGNNDYLDKPLCCVYCDRKFFDKIKHKMHEKQCQLEYERTFNTQQETLINTNDESNDKMSEQEKKQIKSDSILGKRGFLDDMDNCNDCHDDKNMSSPPAKKRHQSQL